MTPEQFVRTWQTGETAQEVADPLGMRGAIVQARASKSRGPGVPRKFMPRGKDAKLTYAGLKRLADDRLRGEGE